MENALEKALENGVWVLYSFFFFLIRDACYRQAGYMYIMNTFEPSPSPFNKLTRRHCQKRGNFISRALADHLSRLWAGTHFAQWLDFLNTVNIFFFSDVADHKWGDKHRDTGPSIARMDADKSIFFHNSTREYFFFFKCTKSKG